MQTLVDALADLARTLGVAIETDTPVTALRSNGDGVAVEANDRKTVKPRDL